MRTSDSPNFRDFVLRRALLPTGWAEDVWIRVDERGFLERVEAGAPEPPDGAVPVRGPVVPGVANVHSHAHQRLMAGRAERSGPGPDSFWTWRETMYRFALQLEPEDLEAVAAMAYVEMLEAGFTAVGEFQYLHHDRDGRRYADVAEMSLRCLAAARTVGLPITILPVMYARGGFDDRPLHEGQRRFDLSGAMYLEVVEALRHAVRPGYESWGIAPHSLRAVAPDALRQVVSETRDLDPEAPVHIHVAEQRLEVDDCLAANGRRPVAWLLDQCAGGAAVDHRWCLIHATHMEADEIEGVASSGALVGLCPTTEANLGDGVFSAAAFLAAGGGFAVGSDSLVRISVAEELRQLETSQRLVEGRRTVLAQRESSNGRLLFDAACAGGARALRQPTGTLEVGRRADWVELDPNHPRLLCTEGDETLDAWIFAGDARCVRGVWIGGDPLVVEGRHVRRETVCERYREVVRRLTRSNGSTPVGRRGSFASLGTRTSR